MDRARLTILLHGHLAQTLSEDESWELAALVNQASDEELDESMLPLWEVAGERYRMSPEEARDIRTRILPKTRMVAMQRMRWGAVAATILVVIGVMVLYRAGRQAEKPSITARGPALDIPAPKGSRTTLTLGSGQRIVLDSANTGLLASEGGSSIDKKDSTGITYRTAGAAASDIVYNTLTTARGGQAHVVLADGSRVWLNTASSLRFPTAFAGKERAVELTGEAYFEIAKNAGQPFVVHVPGGDVRVLGTGFDINAYKDEPVVKTTLVDGQVELVKGPAKEMLRPGQQGIWTADASNIRVNTDVDVDGALAWKNGWFQFESQDIPSILRQVARWYDVEIVYSGMPPKDRFSGVVSRKDKVSQVLKIMEQANIHFQIEGRKITLLP